MNVTRELFDMPPEVARLPRDHRGYPVPAFATWDKAANKWDFVRVSPEFYMRALDKRLCWVCGGRMGKRMWFVTGPMCTMTLASAEPPVHRGCGIFSVKNCPFITRPLAKRADRTGKAHHTPGGVMIERNPGVTAMMEVKNYKVIYPQGRALVRMGRPVDITWWREGRPATADEIIASIESGVPELYKLAESEGPVAVAEMEELFQNYISGTLARFLPPLTSQSSKDSP